MVGLGSSGNTTLNENLASIKAIEHIPTRLGKGGQGASDDADCRVVSCRSNPNTDTQP